jgi:hypothetical protein
VVLFVATAFAPTTVSPAIWIPGNTDTPAPSQTSSPKTSGMGTVGRENTEVCRSSISCLPDEIVTFEPTNTSLPIRIPPTAFIHVPDLQSFFSNSLFAQVNYGHTRLYPTKSLNLHSLYSLNHISIAIPNNKGTHLTKANKNDAI